MLILLTNCDNKNQVETFDLTTTISPDEAGEVTPSGGTYEGGEQLSLQATPNEGWLFIGWEQDISSTANPINIVMNRDYNVVAVFEERAYPLSLTIDGEGSVQERIIETDDEVLDYPAGTIVELTAIAEDGWEFVEWRGDLDGKDNPSQIIIEEAVVVTAVFEQIFSGSVTDVDGYEYPTIVIGEQEWMAENLRVTKYRNGNSIPNITGNDQWRNELFQQRLGAYSNYANESSNADMYGRLYNWYAVNDEKGICPAGWRVPSDEDWKKLEQYLGMSNLQINTTEYRGNKGGMLKTTGTDYWMSPNTGATNETRFFALPGGTRALNSGNFNEIRSRGSWWSSTPSAENIDLAGARSLSYERDSIFRIYTLQWIGSSVRCIKGEETQYVDTRPVSNITETSAESGGELQKSFIGSIEEKGVCWSTSPAPGIFDDCSSDGSGSGNYTSKLSELSSGSTYYVRAFLKVDGGVYYGQERTLTTFSSGNPTVTTTSVIDINSNSAQSGGNVVYEGSASVLERGVVWSTNQNPTIDSNQGITTDGEGTGSFISSLSGLNTQTLYYVRAYAMNSVGTSYGSEVSFTTLVEGGKTEVVEVTNPATGKTWMDRNLGASRAATSNTDTEAYGDLYQWGRGSDGHEKRTSTTTTTLSSSDQPGHGSFILTSIKPNDWRSPQKNNLWQWENGTNNPCPNGYRLPTFVEWNTELQSWSSYDRDGAYSSPLKLPVAGYRASSSGSINSAGNSGGYWSSTVSVEYARMLSIHSVNADMFASSRADGLSVRCIKH